MEVFVRCQCRLGGVIIPIFNSTCRVARCRNGVGRGSNVCVCGPPNGEVPEADGGGHLPGARGARARAPH